MIIITFNQKTWKGKHYCNPFIIVQYAYNKETAGKKQRTQGQQTRNYSNGGSTKQLARIIIVNELLKLYSKLEYASSLFIVHYMKSYLIIEISRCRCNQSQRVPGVNHK